MEIQRYKPKHSIKAICFSGINSSKISELIGHNNWEGLLGESGILIQTTNDGKMKVKPNDYIVKTDTDIIKVMNQKDFHNCYEI